jgi:hypothetical protein
MAKEWTDEERKAFGDKMKKARADKKQTPSEEIKEEPSTQELLDMIKELKSQVDKPSGGMPEARVTASGLVGTVEKYRVDPDLYPSPVARLREEPRLQQFAFKVNYDLGWGVDITSYQTKDGLNVKEPRFTLQLNKLELDDNGQKTGKAWVIKRMIMHEDPQSAIAVARENGLEVDDDNSPEFLNEMRYMRMRDWLIGVFYPPKQDAQERRREEVLDGRVVEVFQVPAGAEGTVKPNFK